MSLEASLYLLNHPSLDELASETQEAFIHTMIHYADEATEDVAKGAASLARAYGFLHEAAEDERVLDWISGDEAESAFRDSWLKAWSAASGQSREEAEESYGHGGFDFTASFPRQLLTDAGRIVARVEAAQMKVALSALAADKETGENSNESLTPNL